MPNVRMTDRWVQGLQPRERRFEVTDLVVPGLRLRVTPAGVKTWAVSYRAGRMRRLTLGRFPTLSLAAARDMARATLADVVRGADPAGDKRAARQAITWGDLAADYLRRHAATKRSGPEQARILRVYVPKAWGTRAAASIERGEIRRLLDALAARAPWQANRALAVIRRVFNFGLEWDLVPMNPCHRLGRPGGPERSRDRWLTRDELRAVWAALEAEDAETRAIFRLLILTGQRSGEVRSMRWADLDLGSGWWTVPSGHAKNQQAHRVPLSPRALALLLEQRDHVETPSPWVFPASSATGHRESLAKALARLRKAVGAHFRIHDLRRSCATYLAGDLGVSRLVVGRILNHAESGVTAIYDRASYDAEKRAALEAWAAHLEAIVRGETGPAKVVPLRA